MRKTRAGFTLIEVLIVVVIIAVLAALIMPRFLGQTEAAKLAEAYQMIGVLTRAEQQYMDMNPTIAAPPVISCATPPASCADGGSNATTLVTLKTLGLADFPQRNFIYFCDGNIDVALCGAYRGNAIGSTYPRISKHFVFKVWPVGVNVWQCIQGYVRADNGAEGYNSEPGPGCRKDPNHDNWDNVA